MALASTATTNHVSICHRLVTLASHFLYAFHRNHNISYLEESISLSRHGLEFSVTQGRDHALGLQMLRKGLLDRFQLLRHQEVWTKRSFYSKCQLTTNTQFLAVNYEMHAPRWLLHRTFRHPFCLDCI